jgi:hypothetical protein
MKISMSDFIGFVEWFHKQAFVSNPYIRIDYLFKYWIEKQKYIK